MEILIGLVAVVAACELYRTYLGKRAPTKRDHFKRRLQNTREMIWDLQFKVFKTREIREDIRQEYDMMKARIENLTQSIANFPKDGDQGEKARLEDDKKLAEDKANRYVAQMKELDLEVEGAAPSKEMPSGATGITHNIDSLRELESMIKDYIKGV